MGMMESEDENGQGNYGDNSQGMMSQMMGKMDEMMQMMNSMMQMMGGGQAGGGMMGGASSPGGGGFADMIRQKLQGR